MKVQSQSQYTQMRISLTRHWQLYLLIIPPLLYLFLFKYLPMIGVIIAFKDYNVVKGILGSSWAGFKHFDYFFGSPNFWTLIQNTIWISFYGLMIAFPAPILLALALNEIKDGRFKKSAQMITYAPYFISTVILASMIILLLSPGSGIVNKVLSFVGIAPVHFLGEASWFSSIFVWSDVWQNTGYGAIIYLAALAGIDPHLYEAAKIDGASRFKKVLHVDLPGILPAVTILLILNVGTVMHVSYEKIYLLQNPLNLSSSEVLSTFVYKMGLLNANYSFASAVGVFNSVINLCLLLGVNALARRVSSNSLW